MRTSSARPRPVRSRERSRSPTAPSASPPAALPGWPPTRASSSFAARLERVLNPLARGRSCGSPTRAAPIPREERHPPRSAARGYGPPGRSRGSAPWRRSRYPPPWRTHPRPGAGAGSRPVLVLRAAQDVARRELELLLRGNRRGRVLLARQVVLHVVGCEEERRARVVVLAVSTYDDNCVRVSTLRQIVAQLVGLLPCDVDDPEAAVLRGHVQPELGIVLAELDGPVANGLYAQLPKNPRHDRDRVRFV